MTGRPSSSAATPGSRRNETCRSRSSITPARPGAEPAGRRMSLPGAVPSLFSPGFSQNSPASASQPPGALRRVSRSPRQASISALYDAPPEGARAAVVPSAAAAPATTASVSAAQVAFMVRVYQGTEEGIVP